MLGLLVACWASGVIASVNYPPIPSDKTTPTQQRLAYNGPNGNDDASCCAEL
jgi:hypothetical protein